MKPCGSWLACDADTLVYQVYRVDAIAGKPAPTFDCVRPWHDVTAHWPGSHPSGDSPFAGTRPDWTHRRHPRRFVEENDHEHHHRRHPDPGQRLGQSHHRIHP
ncbi:hypothetical protein F7R12_06225 [Pseudomonas tolaasii]|nr:hypothetical protein F7R12_06225 [Pseudomonas tolaasii]